MIKKLLKIVAPMGDHDLIPEQAEDTLADMSDDDVRQQYHVTINRVQARLTTWQETPIATIKDLLALNKLTAAAESRGLVWDKEREMIDKNVTFKRVIHFGGSKLHPYMSTPTPRLLEIKEEAEAVLKKLKPGTEKEDARRKLKHAVTELKFRKTLEE